MGESEKKALKRFGRNLFALFISGLTAYLTGKPYMIGLAPVLNGLAKWLREKAGIQYLPL